MAICLFYINIEVTGSARVISLRPISRMLLFWYGKSKYRSSAAGALRRLGTLRRLGRGGLTRKDKS